MKIRKLHIKNYKIFDDVEFDFTDAAGNTLDTIVLAGVNGCGKTTVLDMISMFLNHNFMGEFEQSEVTMEVEITLKKSEWRLLKPISIPKDLPDLSDKRLELKRLEFKLNHEGYWRINEILGPARKGPYIGVYFPVKITEHLGGKEHLIISEISRDIKDAKALSLKYARDEVFKNKNLPPQAVIDTQLAAMTSALRDIDLNTRLIDLESEELIFQSANGQRIYFDQLSHGEQNLYFRAIYLSQLNIQDGIIMVDEPEAAFHPTWQQKIAQLYRNIGENNQVFMATHSPHIMASVPPESLFVLHIEEKDGGRKIKAVNMAKAGKHSQGLEPNRILKEVMQVETLRDYQTQRDIEHMADLLTLERFETKEAEDLAEKLTDQLGREDPFILRMEHQLLMLHRKKASKTTPVAV